MSEDEKAVGALFDRAMELRDRGESDAACALLEDLLAHVPDGNLAAHSHVQCGYLRRQQGRFVEAEKHYLTVTRMRPKFELASLGLFHLLLDRERTLEALTEALRLVSLRESLAYRELFDGNTFREGLTESELKVADAVRSALWAHREAQARKLRPERGDTVRIHSDAPVALRPGELACVREVRGTTSFVLMYADGERAEVPAELVLQLTA